MTITLTREEAQSVLHALESCSGVPHWPAFTPVIKTLRARLAQPEPDYRDVVIAGDLWRIEFLPDHAASVVLVRANYEAQLEPEPVAWMSGNVISKNNIIGGTPLYNAPPQREWQGLTDEEVHEAFCHVEYETFNDWKQNPESWCLEFFRHIEAKLKEKNT